MPLTQSRVLGICWIVCSIVGGMTLWCTFKQSLQNFFKNGLKCLTQCYSLWQASLSSTEGRFGITRALPVMVVLFMLTLIMLTPAWASPVTTDLLPSQTHTNSLKHVTAYSSEVSPEPPSTDLNGSENPNSAFAFGSYLGTGVYRAADQNATIVSIPLVFDLHQDDDSQVWLRLPVSFGFFNYLARDITEGDFPTEIGTMTVTPGVEYHWRATESTRFESYVDLGFGTRFNQGGNVAIFAAGLSSLVDFTLINEDAVWVTRLSYAGYSEYIGKVDDQYALLQSGVDLGLPVHWQWHNAQVQPRVFTVGYWYFDKLRFVDELNEDTLVSGSYELGASLAFAKPFGGHWLGYDELGVDRISLSFRAGGGLNIWRISFSFPI